jgi:hypothetical protein
MYIADNWSFSPKQGIIPGITFHWRIRRKMVRLIIHVYVILASSFRGKWPRRPLLRCSRARSRAGRGASWPLGPCTRRYRRRSWGWRSRNAIRRLSWRPLRIRAACTRLRPACMQTFFNWSATPCASPPPRPSISFQFFFLGPPPC